LSLLPDGVDRRPIDGPAMGSLEDAGIAAALLAGARRGT
jgi:hypothetical protein